MMPAIQHQTSLSKVLQALPVKNTKNFTYNHPPPQFLYELKLQPILYLITTINTTNETEKCLETSCLILSTIQDSVNILQTPPGF